MTTTFALPPETVTRLDYGMLRRVMVTLAMVLVVLSPLAPDPMAIAIGRV